MSVSASLCAYLKKARKLQDTYHHDPSNKPKILQKINALNYHVIVKNTVYDSTFVDYLNEVMPHKVKRITDYDGYLKTL